MKKVLVLMLALVLALSCVSAFAEMKDEYDIRVLVWKFDDAYGSSVRQGMTKWAELVGDELGTKINIQMYDAADDMAKQIENLCAANSEVIVQHVEASFDRQMQEGSQNVRAAYDNLINGLEGELNRMKAQQGQKAEVKRFLEEQLQSVIPSLQSQM